MAPPPGPNILKHYHAIHKPSELYSLLWAERWWGLYWSNCEGKAYDGHSRHVQLELSWLSIQNTRHAVDCDSPKILNCHSSVEQRSGIEKMNSFLSDQKMYKKPAKDPSPSPPPPSPECKINAMLLQMLLVHQPLFSWAYYCALAHPQ